MSKYTTEVRFICEQYAGLTESVGFDEIDNVIQLALSNPDKHIFDVSEASKYKIFDESYRNVLNTAILKHYYTREICAETVGLWKLWLNNRMREIMPKYNKLYESALLDFNPFYDIDISRTHSKDESTEGNEEREINNSSSNNRTYDETVDSTNSQNASGTNEASKEYSGTSMGANSGTEDSTMSKDHKDKYSDTPQGTLAGVDGTTYLTNYRSIGESGEGHSENSTSSSSTEANKETTSETNSQSNLAYGNEKRNSNTGETNLSNSKHKNTNSIVNAETYLEHVKGKQSGTSYSKLLLEYRDTFLNIDQMVINELSDLFFGLWD